VRAQGIAGHEEHQLIAFDISAQAQFSKPPVDLSPMSCMRFQENSWSEAQLLRDATWQYRQFYGAV
jgi:hypothetical protein